jgi:hypothetical protein
MSNRREGGHCTTHKRNHQDGCLDCSIAREEALQQRLTAADERICQLTKPQGVQVACMPVERCYDVRAKMIIAFNEATKAGGDLDDALDAAYKSALRYSPNPLSSEQLAQIAAGLPVDPERERLMEIVQQYPNVDPLKYDDAVRTLRK